MRIAGRITTILLCTLVAMSVLVPLAHARASSQYRIEGRGWGHGIGMSQYGAAGYAARGWTSKQIIEHYYSGTVVAPRPADGPTSVRVLLQSYLAPARIQMTSAGIVSQGAASLDLLPKDIVTMQVVNGALAVTRIRPGASSAVVAKGSSADATIVPSTDGGAKALFANDNGLSGRSFRGTLTGHIYSGKVSVVNTVPFESYLRGVVPDESIPSWPAAALEAQAIAARSYALTGLQRELNWFDLYSDTRSQVYNGVESEEESTDAAIAATANLVARVGGPDGELARTFFFSTSGGRTAGNEQVWGSSPYSYLRPVASPYEHASKYFFWKGDDIKRYTPTQLAAALGYSGSFRGASNTVYPSGYADDVLVRTTSGTKSISADKVQARLGLRSTYFRIQLLSISAPDGVAPGAFVTLRGRAPLTGTTTVLLRRDGARAIPVKVKPTGPLGTWVVRTRMPSISLAAVMTRDGIVGPRINVAAASLAAMSRR